MPPEFSTSLQKHLRNFLFPKLTRRALLRLLIIACSALIFFRYICQPVIIHGGSMLPTYPDHGLNFCWHPAYWFSPPSPGDIVIMEYGSSRTLILKRLIACEGDTVEFRNGDLLVNGKVRKEPYIRHKGNWNLPERTVEKDHYYLVGDNRLMNMEDQIFGQMHRKFLTGKPLW